MGIDSAVLSRFSDLDSLSEEDRRMMAGALKEDRFKAGSQICREGDLGEGCWFLVSGSVDVTTVLPDGRKVKLATLGPGVAFGQSGLVEGQARTAEVKAAEDLYILTLTRKSLQWALNRREAWAVAIQALVAINLVKQLRSALARLSELAAAEDASLAATGRSRDEIVRPKALDVDFSKVRAKQAAAAAQKASATEEIAQELGEYDAGASPMTSQGLMNLLRDTESSLSGQGFDLDNVEFVMDEDMRRTSEARGH